MKEHISLLSSEETIELLASHLTYGLSEREAHLRRKEYARNELPPLSFRSMLPYAFHPYLLVFFVLALFTAFFTKSIFLSSLPILWATCTSCGFLLLRRQEIQNIFQKRKYLDDLFPEYSSVLRGGKLKTIPTEELVPGDIIYLSQDEYVGADVRILSSSSLIIDESALFGPMYSNREKTHHEMLSLKNESSFDNIMYAGSFISTGSSKSIVWKTGSDRRIEEILPPTVQIQNPFLQVKEYIYLFFHLTLIFLSAGVTILQWIPFQSWGYLSLILAFFSPLTYPFFKLLCKSPQLLQHRLIPLESFLKVRSDKAEVFLQGTSHTLLPGIDLKKNKLLLTHFFELFFLSFPQDIGLNVWPELSTLRQHVEHVLKITTKTPTEATNFIFEQDQHFFKGKTLFDTGDNEEMLHLIFTHPKDLLLAATYIFDEHMHMKKRRFFKGEKERIFQKIHEAENEGALLYGLGIEEIVITTKKKNDSLTTFVGYVSIPQFFQKMITTTTEEHVWFYSFRAYNEQFLKGLKLVQPENITPAINLLHKSGQYFTHFTKTPERIIHGCTTKQVKDLAMLLTTKNTVPHVLWNEEELEHIFPITHGWKRMGHPSLSKQKTHYLAIFLSSHLISMSIALMSPLFLGALSFWTLFLIPYVPLLVLPLLAVSMDDKV